MITKQKHFYFIAFMLMASAFLPIVFNNLPPLIRSHHIWTSIWVLSLLVFYPKVFINKMMVYVLIYSVFLFVALNFMWNSMDEWNYYMLIKEYYQIAIGISVITYFLQSKDYIGLAKITKWSMVFLIITAIMTIVSSAIDPMYARNIVGVASINIESKSEAILSFTKFGGGNFGTAIAFMCLFPILIYYYKNTTISLLSKIQVVILLVIIFLALLGMQIFANILIGFVFSVIAFGGMKKMKQSVLVFGLFLSIILFTPKEVYIDSLFSISNSFQKNSDLNYKFRDLAIFIKSGADVEDIRTGTGIRANRFSQLADNFTQSPIFGVFVNSDKYAHGYYQKYLNYGTVGQVAGTHLHWMNKLTITGIIGLFIFLLIPYNFIKSNVRRFDSTFNFYYLLASLSILSYGIFKTMAGRETWYTFFIILPGLYYLPLLKKQNYIFRNEK
ncbi:MAG: hypothetical protein HXX14_11580 [Bacteroidetes bacterium]|nr:hypothetical protein [Bacteroidota bacterium]